MKDITSNEMQFVLHVLKSPHKAYNARNMAQELGMSAMGSLKIAKRLEQEGILLSQQIGHAKIYRINLKNEYTREYVRFLVKREAEYAPIHVKAWLRELQRVQHAELAIVFGSILKKKEAHDVDVLLVSSQKSFAALRKEVE